jgi:hypothetical protein
LLGVFLHDSPSRIGAAIVDHHNLMAFDRLIQCRLNRRFHQILPIENRNNGADFHALATHCFMQLIQTNGAMNPNKDNDKALEIRTPDMPIPSSPHNQIASGMFINDANIEQTTCSRVRPIPLSKLA